MENIDWLKCLICQEHTSENLSCPLKRSQFESITVYGNFLNNFSQFKEIGCLPINCTLPNEISSDDLIKNEAKWHRSCHQSFNNSKLNRELKRASIPVINAQCLFCEETGGKLHCVSTLNADINLKQMSIDLQDDIVLRQIGIYDSIAIKAKYHFHCMSTFRNRHRLHIQRNLSNGRTNSRQLKALAFVHLINIIEDGSNNGATLFQLTDLHNSYENKLREFGLEVSTNKTRLKNDLMEHFESQGMQEKMVGKSTVLFFPDGMKQILKEAIEEKDYIQNFVILSKAAKICRQDIFQNSNSFNGKLEDQGNVNYENINTLISQILYGAVFKSSQHTQQTKSITQTIIHNAKLKTATYLPVNTRNSLSQEMPLQIYIGLNIHSTTRSKKLINQMYRLGLSISYNRVCNIENSMAMALCQQFQNDGIVCPSNLRKGIFTVGAMDNIDHNPSSTSATGSFHGTGISLMQQPSKDQPGINRQKVQDKSQNDMQLPYSYTTIPDIAIKKNVAIPPCNRMGISNELTNAIDLEDMWLTETISKLTESVEDCSLTWAAFHANRLPETLQIPAITSMLPLFDKKSDDPSMVMHSMMMINSCTQYLNPGQIAVMACDCPIFAVAKKLQWLYPSLVGEDKFLVMFGGLHLEKGLWNAMGDLLEGSGWTELLEDASIATSGTADSFLKSTHIMKTRYSHQITVLVLTKLMQDAFEASNEMDMEVWKEIMIASSPTFQFWNMIIELEILILIVIRSQREANFRLYVDSLKSLMFLFFSLDRPNYSRWLTIHIRDMESLPSAIRQEFEEHWVLNKTGKRFSSMPLDQVHEQENCKLKNQGGIIGITSDSKSLQKWLLVAPENARLLTEFENQYWYHDNSDEYQHHDENQASQLRFANHVENLADSFNKYTNPFAIKDASLINIHSGVCPNDEVTNSYQNLRHIGEAQYKEYENDMLSTGNKSIIDPVNKNNLPLFRKRTQKLESKKLQMAELQSDVNLFGQLYIANQLRNGDIENFFSHENHAYPPALSEFGKLRTGSKSDLLNCLDIINHIHPNKFDCCIFDGPALVHMLPVGTSSTFTDYATKVFLPHLSNTLNNVERVDVVWDRYDDKSLKNAAREKRGNGIRRKIMNETRIPTNWKDFLRNSDNKTDLFDFLSDVVQNAHWINGKDIYITKGSTVLTNSDKQMPSCTHEEADTRIVVHIKHAIQSGHSKVFIRTVDTDVIVILLGQFTELKKLSNQLDLWIMFGTGKDVKHISINEVYSTIGPDISQSLPFFHALTGCDTTSFFFHKGKKSFWKALQNDTNTIEIFTTITANPFTILHKDDQSFACIESFIANTYKKTTNRQSVNACRLELFSHGRNIDGLPPTQVYI